MRTGAIGIVDVLLGALGLDRRRFLLTSLAGAVAAPLAAKAKARGLTIPASLLLRADQMIDQ
jgi:hypothetical protein